MLCASESERNKYQGDRDKYLGVGVGVGVGVAVGNHKASSCTCTPVPKEPAMTAREDRCDSRARHTNSVRGHHRAAGFEFD